MKYIIDAPDDLYVVNGTLRVPVKVGNGDKSWYNTYLTAEPYTDPGREAIEDDVWKFAGKIVLTSIDGGFSVAEITDCFGHIGYNGIFGSHSYSEAKAKYNEWLKRKAEIRVGDEVVYDTERYNHEVKAVVLRPETDDKYAVILTLHNLNRITASKDELRKTGRHFDEVEELLKKMKEE